MRTTLDIDDDVLAVVKDIAAANRQSAGKVVSRVLRASLQGDPNPYFYDTDDGEVVNGFHVFPRRPGAVVTMELVNRLRDEE